MRGGSRSVSPTEQHVVDVAPTGRLLAVLREDLALTGAKHGCGEGACGACAVLLDGRAIASCLLPVGAAEGHEVTTIEGLGEAAAALQHAFVAEDALQCGFCTPGQMISASALLTATPTPTPEQIRGALAGNLCRCGAYPKIEEAIRTWQG